MLVDQLLSGLAVFTNIIIKILTGRLNTEYYTLSYILLTCFRKNNSRYWEQFLKCDKKKREVYHPQESRLTYF